MDELYDMAEEKRFVHIEEYDKDAEVIVKNKRYVATFEYNGEPVQQDAGVAHRSAVQSLRG